MSHIDPTAWLGEDGLPDARRFDALIGVLFLSAITLLIGGIGFWLGRVTA